MLGFENITGPPERVNQPQRAKRSQSGDRIFVPVPRALAWGTALLVAAKCLLLMGVEFGKDEAAYWYWARYHLDASYAFVMLAVIRLADVLWAGNDMALRLPFIVAGAGSAWLMNAACEKTDLTTTDRLAAVLAFVTCHWAWHTGSFLHPDGVLVPLWLATLAAADRAWRSQQDHHWLLTGILGGLVALSKYTGCVLMAGLLLALTLRGRQGFRGLLWTGIPCAIVASPLIWALWGLDFHLPFTLGSLSQVAASDPVWWRAGLFLLAPLLYLSPPLLWLLYSGLYRGWQERREQGVDLVLIPALVLLATFGVFALVNGQVKGNWVLPGLLGIWPLAFHGLHQRRFHRNWWAGLLVLGIGMTAVPALTLRWPTLAQQLVDSAPAAVDATYPAIVSPTDLPREPTFSWTERVCEYHGWADFGQDLSQRLQHDIGRADRVHSAEYGLGYGLGRYLPDAPRVTITDDARFAHIADASLGDASIYVTRSGGAIPSAALARQPRQIDTMVRQAPGCGPVGYDVYLLSGHAASADNTTESR